LRTYASVTAQKVSTILLITSAILLLLIGKINEGNLRTIKNHFTDLSSYILSIVGIPINSINKTTNQINSLISIYSDNKSLNLENKELYKWKDLGQRLLVENQELKKLLNAVKQVPYNFITAKVIANSSGSYIKTITLNVGAKNDVIIGSPVVNNWGMIGRVIEVGRNSSRVLLITDINSQIPIYFEKSKHKAIVIGKNSDLLEVKYLKPRVNLINNERIITSGEGGLLPRGLSLGLYLKTLNSENNKVKILPTRGWDHFDNLNVILFKNNKSLN